MNEDLAATRRALHAVAELLIAGPQFSATGDIRLKASDDGFRGWTSPVGVSGTVLITPTARVPLRGRISDVARAAGIASRSLREVYSGGPEFSEDEPLVLSAPAAKVLLRAFVHGDAALRLFAPAEDPVLWPEHFDIAITVAEVNYGVSPGDAGIPEPYAYVGPWRVPAGTFWNEPFGAARPLTELPTPQHIRDFFAAGRLAARADGAAAG